MKQVWNKSAAILLILCMIITLIPQYAFAGEVSIQSRDKMLPLGNPSQWFQFIKINSNGEYESEGAYADIKNYTNTAEGWEWYPDGDSAQGYAKKTLILKGIQLDTSDPIAITLPDEATIILKEGTTNVVRSTYNGTNESFGIYCYGRLTIKGGGTLEVRGGADVSSLEYSGGIHSTGTLEIKDGTIHAECGYGEVESKAISSNAMIDISGGTITAMGGEAINISYGIYGQTVKVTDGTIHAAGGEAINASYGIYGQTLKFSDGTTYAKAEDSPSQYFAVYSGEKNGLDDTGMKVLHKNGNNYTVPVTKEDNGKFYFVDTDYAFDVRIQKAPPASAEIDNVTLSGVVGMPLPGTVTINLSGDTFVSENLAVDSAVTNWFAGLSSLSGPVNAVIESFTATQAVIKFIGTPKSVYSEQILITIPAGNLTGNKAITVTPNENARFNIQNPSAGATLSNSLILGAVGQSMNGEVTLYLSGCDFKGLSAGNDVSSWFANSPEGLNATVVSIDNKNPIEKLLVRIAGSPLSALEAPMEITIPADNQTSEQPIPVTLNNNARYHITETWDGRRTSMLDLTAESVSYWSTGKQWTSQNPTQSDILDSDEGWTWYCYGSEELNYQPRTLILDGITLETGDLVGIRLPADSIIILTDGSENIVRCMRSGFSTGDTRGIEGMGALSIRGNNGRLYAAGGNGDTKTSSVGIYTMGDLTISGGEVEAVGGHISQTWVSAGLMSQKNIVINGSSIVRARSEESVYSDSQGIRADNYVTFSGESITYAKGNDFAVYGAYGINDSGLTIRQNVEGNYIGATTRWAGFCYKDSSNQNATDILISKRQALLSDATVSGKPGVPLSGENRLTVSLIYSSFRNDLTVNQNVTSWFTNLPPGAQAKVASIDGNRMKVNLAFSGTPVSGSTGPMVVIIPAEHLADGMILNANVNQYASFDISSNNTAPSASISEKTISGEIGKALSGSATMTITLTDSIFINLSQNDVISSWFINLPEGLTVTLLSIAEDGSSASIGFSGTPLEECERTMEITIPAEKQSIDKPLSVTENSNAKYHITEETTAGPKKRTNALDLTVKELWYKSQTETESSDPTSEDITNSVEGWKWYLYGDEEKGYSPKTLELSGINLEANAASAVKLPADASIVLVDGTINRVKSVYHDPLNTHGIEGNGALTIKGNTGELHATGGTTTENNSIGIVAQKTIVIEGGIVYATGGVSTSSYSGVMSVGIISNQNIIFSGGTIYANSSAAPLSRAVYTLGITDTGMQAFQKKDGSYSQEAQVEGGYYVYGTDKTPATDIRITAVPSVPGPSFGGEGTEADPYLITNKEELKEMAQLVNDQNEKYGSRHYRVMANIILNEDINNESEVWTPIGKNSMTPFTGVFDGGGYGITGLYMKGSASYAGLFGYIDSGAVKDIGIIGGQISASGGDSYAGGIAAYNRRGRIEDCFNTAFIGGTQSGGITGYNEMGHIQDSYNTGQVVGIVAGGIAGVNQDAEMTIVNCYNTGSVNAIRNSNSAYAGGITGKNYSGTIKNSYNAGSISTVSAGAGSVYLGGVSAVNNSSTLVDVYWLDSALVIDNSYGDGNTGSAEAKTSEELNAMAQILNQNAARLSGEYGNLASWIDDMKNENGGYPLFGTVTNYMLTVSGGGTGATASGSYAAGTKVSITAGTKAGYTFSGWTTAGSGVFENTSNAETTFTMPEANATITANWKAKDEPGQGPGPSKPSRPTPSVKTEDTNVLINGKSQSAGKSETTTGSDGKTVTTVTVDSDKLKTLLSSEKDGAKVTIQIKDGVNAGEGKLTGEMVKSMEDKSAILVIQKGASSYTLPAAEINISEISKNLGTNVSLQDITVSVKISEPTNTMAKVVESAEKGKSFTIVAPAVDFTITCTYGGKSVNTASFNSYVERTIAIPEGVDPSKITTGIVVEPSGRIYHVPTRVTVINGKYYAVINSLTNSTYSVVWNPIEFSDMTKHWAKESVNNMGSRMVVTGVGNNSYDPGRNMTRAEFAAIMVRALGLAPDSDATTFSDVKASAWYSGYIKTAVSYGIIKGYDNGNFGPNDTITREQAMTMLSRAMKVTGLKVNLTEQDTSKLVGGYTDSTAIAAYAKESVAACLETGITAGRGNNTIAPKSFITRAEVAVMAERLLKKSDLI